MSEKCRDFLEMHCSNFGYFHSYEVSSVVSTFRSSCKELQALRTALMCLWVSGQMGSSMISSVRDVR